MSKIFFQPKPAGLGDMIAQIQCFDFICQYAGIVLDEKFVYFNDSSMDERMPSENPISRLLIGDNPISPSEAAGLSSLSYSQFHQYVLQHRQIPHESSIHSNNILVIATGDCDKYLFDIQGRRNFFDQQEFTPIMRGYKWLLSDGMIYQAYVDSLSSRLSRKKLAVHIRIGDCWHVTPDQIINEEVSILMSSAIESGCLLGKYNNISDPSPHGRFSTPDVFIDAIASLIDKYGKHDEIHVLSDGFTRLASELHAWAVANDHASNHQVIESALNECYFSSFDDIRPLPRLIIGEHPSQLLPSIVELMLADTLVIGLSALPLALRCAYEIPIPRIVSVNKMYNKNIDFESFGLSHQNL